MGLLSGNSKPEPEPEPEPEPDPLDDDLEERLLAFTKLGFDDFTAIRLAWAEASPSQVRELIRHGASMAQAAAIVL